MSKTAPQQTFSGELKTDESLMKLNSWHVGGCADRTYRPKDLHDLSLFLQSLPPDEPLTWLGLGSNVLIRDGGIRGTVIFTQGLLDDISHIDDNTVRVEAGVTCAKISKFCAKNGFAQGVFFAGIPGTMGGALAMNAGAFGGETWEVVTKAEVIDRHGMVTILPKSSFEIAYRHVARTPDTWFVAAHLYFPHKNTGDTAQDIKQLLKKRSDSQPIGLPSCGSVFKNPKNEHAARLIEYCDLKGHKIGGAEVSPKHANFIINTGDATAKNIEDLIDFVQQTVLDKTGIKLEREVHILGES